MKYKSNLSQIVTILILGSISVHATISELNERSSVTFGQGTGLGEGNAQQQNTFIGQNTGNKNRYGGQNTFVGYIAGELNVDGFANTYIGYGTGKYMLGNYNTLIGSWIGGDNYGHGNNNVALGHQAAFNLTDGSNNTFLGEGSGADISNGSNNTHIGFEAGNDSSGTLTGTVFLGYQAGMNETQNNTLYISNSDTNTPLIYGEFDTGVVKINGELNTTKAITTSLTEDSTANTYSLLTLSRDNTDTDYASDVSFVLENIEDNFKWTFRTLESEQGFSISKVNSGAKEMIITGNDHPDGIQILMGDGGKYSGGQWLVASSRAYKENIKEIDTQKALKAFHQLKPVSFNYKVQKDEPVVGFIAEDVPDMVASKKRDSLSAMEMVALLTKVVQVQEKKIDEKENEIINLQKRLGKIESLLSNITLNISEETPKISLKK